MVLFLLLRRQGSFVIGTFLIRRSPALAARLPRWDRKAGERSAGGNLGFFAGFRVRRLRSGGLGHGVVGRADYGVIRRPKTEGGVGNIKHVRTLSGDDRGISRHTRPQLQILIVHLNDRSVVDNVLVRDRRETHLIHSSREFAAGERVNREVDLLPFLDTANVRLADQGLNLHFGQIIRDGEQLGRVEAGRDSLAGIDLPRDDHAADRGVNGRAVQIHLGAVH